MDIVSGKNSSGVVWDYDGDEFTARDMRLKFLSGKDKEEAEFLLELMNNSEYKKRISKVVHDSIVRFFKEFNEVRYSDEYVPSEGGPIADLEIILNSHYHYVYRIGEDLRADTFDEAINENSLFHIFYEEICNDEFLTNNYPFSIFANTFEDLFNYAFPYIYLYSGDYSLDEYIEWIANQYEEDDPPFDFDLYKDKEWLE